ncbi:hypothetical protein JMJ35_009613 [Cladonia borealis]|uniref:ethanolamine kinase n=1 Tax=Cladonia borealis TaxID=184061 RepID=A0AA39QTP3_9LECA|nr:hypothetical protein JMJ35_009613 [Cladonia borealis]
MGTYFSITAKAAAGRVRRIPLSYDFVKGDASALDLVFMLYPNWKADHGQVNIVRFTGGIMNTLLKLTKQEPKCSERENDKEAVLLRAYGKDSDILVDREMEITTHELLAEKGLAAPLLARFENGLLYKFSPGQVCTTHDLLREPVWRAVAARLGEWHATLPLPSIDAVQDLRSDGSNNGKSSDSITSHFRSINIWTVLQKWTSALPTRDDKEKDRKVTLQKELKRLFSELYREDQEHENYVLGHCDLLSANILIQSGIETDNNKMPGTDCLKGKVYFIDYEYAVPCPPAFDLANHFSEWGGFECDYNMLPTRTTRRAFVEEYLQSFSQHRPAERATEAQAEELLLEVDRFRGIPGFYWGVQSLIQSTISSVEFDWVDYADLRLQEFWDWREKQDRSRGGEGKKMSLRERRWAQEE